MGEGVCDLRSFVDSRWFSLSMGSLRRQVAVVVLGEKLNCFDFWRKKFFKTKRGTFHPGPVETPSGWGLPIKIGLPKSCKAPSLITSTRSVKNNLFEVHVCCRSIVSRWIVLTQESDKYVFISCFGHVASFRSFYEKIDDHLNTFLSFEIVSLFRAATSGQWAV